MTWVNGACPSGIGFEFRLVLDLCGSGGSFVGGLSKMDSGGLSFLDRDCTMVPVEFSSRMKLALAFGQVPPFLVSLCDSLFFRRERFRTLLVSLTENYINILYLFSFLLLLTVCDIHIHSFNLCLMKINFGGIKKHK